MAAGLIDMGKSMAAECPVDLPPFWEEAKAELMKRDRIMRKLIPQFGDLHLIARNEPFVALARSIVGQQISIKTADAVWQNLVELCPKCTPAQFLKAGDRLVACGQSSTRFCQTASAV